MSITSMIIGNQKKQNYSDTKNYAIENEWEVIVYNLFGNDKEFQIIDQH